MGIVILRTVLVYVLVVFAVRMMGKRQIGELQPSELVTTILISNLASLSVEETNLALIPSLMPIFIIVGLEIILSVFEIRSKLFSRVISGTSEPVIRDGVIDQSALLALRFGISDLLEALRTKDVFDIREVAYAVVETNGSLNVYKRDMNAPDDRPTVNLIVDGAVQFGSLRYIGKDEAWLLKKTDGRRTEDIYLMQCDKDDVCTVVMREGL